MPRLYILRRHNVDKPVAGQHVRCGGEKKSLKKLMIIGCCTYLSPKWDIKMYYSFFCPAGDNMLVERRIFPETKVPPGT